MYLNVKIVPTTFYSILLPDLVLLSKPVFSPEKLLPKMVVKSVKKMTPLYLKDKFPPQLN